MSYENELTEFIPVKLDDGTTVKIEVTQMGREDVAATELPFKQVTKALEGIVQAIAGTLEKVKPDKASVKFGMEVGVEAGALTAMIVKGTGKGNLEIALEWNNTSQRKPEHGSNP